MIRFLKRYAKRLLPARACGAAGFFSRHKPTVFLELHLNYLEERKLSSRAVLETLARCGRFTTARSESCTLSPAEWWHTACTRFAPRAPSAHRLARRFDANEDR